MEQKLQIHHQNENEQLKTRSKTYNREANIFLTFFTKTLTTSSSPLPAENETAFVLIDMIT